MSFFWQKWLKGQGKAVCKSRTTHLCLESLEDRTTPATITVTTVSDAVAVDGAVSLREAIQSINAGMNINADVNAVGAYGSADTINFNIGAGLQAIKVTGSALPTLTSTAIIDGTPPAGNLSQVIELDGSLSGAGANGLTINAAHTTVRGLVIGNFSGNGVEIEKSAVTVVGDFIGTNSNYDDLGNGGFGVVIDSTSNNVIGTANAADHNLISRNKAGGIEIQGMGLDLPQNNVVANNDVGAPGNNAGNDDTAGNGGMGIYLTNGAWGNQIGVKVVGGVTTGAPNVIAGNMGAGVVIDRGAQGNQVAGNYIGIRDNGNTTGQVVGNQGYGVEIQGLVGLDPTPPKNNIIGGANSAEQNVISGNASAGVYIYGSATDNTVEDNRIGTDTQGGSGYDGQGHITANGGDGVLIENSSNNTIGAPNAGNVISSNLGNGVSIIYGVPSNPNSPTGNVVDSNFIGADAAGADSDGSLTNGKSGVNIAGADKTHLVNNTQITNNTIFYNPTEAAQAGLTQSFTGGANTIKGNTISKHEPQPPPPPSPPPPVPCVIIADSTGDTIGNNIIQGGVEQDSSAVTVNGTLSITDDYVENGGTLTLQGASLTTSNLDVSTDAVFSGDGTVNGNVNNAGEVDTDASGNPLAVTGDYTQTAGVTNVGDGALSVGGDYDQSGGTVTVGEYGGTLSVGGATTLSGGALDLLYGASLSSVGAVSVSGGTLQLDEGTLTAPTVQVGASGLLSGYGTITGNVANAGTVMVPDNSTLSVSGSYTQSAGATEVGSSAYNGELAVSGAVTEQGGTILLANATLQAGGGLEIESGAALSGYGTITGNVSNAGSLTVGGGYYASLRINGNYTQTSGGALTVDLMSGSDPDTLSVSGQAALDGAFTLDSVDGQTPPVGTWLSVLYYGSRSGAFATLNLPTLSSGVWDPVYNDANGDFLLEVNAS